MYQLYIHSIPPDDGLQICPKHVEVDCRNKLRINIASGWFSLHTVEEYELYEIPNLKCNENINKNATRG
jgi:hypothetical protein